MVRFNCPDEWFQWVDWLAAGLHGRHRWRLPIVLAGGRRTVASWLRAAAVGDHFSGYYYFIPKEYDWKFRTKLQLAVMQLQLLAACLLAAGKKVWAVVDGAWQQQVRDIWANIGAYNLILSRAHAGGTLGLAPAERRNLRPQRLVLGRPHTPSATNAARRCPADRRKALRRLILENELSTLTSRCPLPRKILRLAHHLIQLAA